MVIAKISETKGLCSTCNNAPTCFYRASRGPALFCELFDDYVPPVRQTRDIGVASAAAASVAPQRDGAEYVGLCMNCENRQACALPKPAGGIWHCEEYR